ncbi:MAG TPA: M42 family peptidase [Thermosulfidibacter takaii]|uniref:M42 family peptidase n=1 Tax=Thermosulfidibacter takaii TaxID=412593 RepID=A0A7C0U706_9BACT|nr:MAG: M42 family peptidase [Aquificota bacterium]HDD53587.1 M42 family peptidase [Thermosulfidibacter takaii]
MALDLELLRRLVETPSPSGFEGKIRGIIKEEMEKVAHEVKVDYHGNVIGVLNPQAPLRVMAAGHCDEIGLMVKYVDDQGFIYFSAIGGVDPGVLDGQRVKIITSKGEITGVIGKKPIHLMEEKDRGKPLKIHQLWIDIGASDGDEARKVVSPGDPVVIEGSLTPLLNDLVVARGFDDRIGVFVVLEAFKRLADREIQVSFYAVATVQEELGLRGARTSAFSIDPQVGIAVDVGFATDYPEVEKKRVGDIKLGKGPILHRGANINPVLSRFMEEMARKRDIEYQLTGEPRATGTDANAIQVTRGGVATALVSIPNRYMHTPVEVVSLKDVEGAVELITETVAGLSPDMDFTPLGF